MSVLFSINRVELMGRLAADPELKHTPNGTAVCKLRIATDRSYKQGDEWKKETEFTSVTVWAKDAEHCGEKLHKGSFFHVVSGRLQTRNYDKDGVKRYVTEVVANEIAFPDGWAGDKKSEPTTHEKAKANGYQPQPENAIPF